MPTSAIHPRRAASCCLSPVAHWRTLLAYLLEKHFGMDLNDTPFCSESVILQHIEAGVTLATRSISWWKNMNWCALIAVAIPIQSQKSS